jgi:hypothetical protein
MATLEDNLRELQDQMTDIQTSLTKISKTGYDELSAINAETQTEVQDEPVQDYFEDDDNIVFGNKKNDDSFIDMLLGAIISIIIIIIAVTMNLYGFTS